MKPIFVPKTPHDKALQRALMQWRKPQNRALVKEALQKTGREDLIGYGKRCLIRPDKNPGQSMGRGASEQKGKAPSKAKKEAKSFDGRHRVEKKDSSQNSKPVRKAGWAKAKPKKNTKKH